MSNPCKATFLNQLQDRYGGLRKLEGSLSLYEIGKGAARVYIRYSKFHDGRGLFYGLRQDDLRRLEGFPSVICFLWEGQYDPLLISSAKYEGVFASIRPASDGQYKAHIFLEQSGVDLYVGQAGHFNVEGYLGWGELDRLIDETKTVNVPELSHSQVQTILGAIGVSKGFDVWVPDNDRGRLDWSLTTHFKCRELRVPGFSEIESILHEVDVLWVQRGTGTLQALFEVEHSTPIYSGLLRFNDVHLVEPNLRPRFYIVANDEREETFARQMRRPTFRTSGLMDLCSFLEYTTVYAWHSRQASGATLHQA